MTSRAFEQGPPKARRMMVADDEYAAVSEGRIRIRIGAAIFMFTLFLVVLRLGEVSLFTPRDIGGSIPQAITTTRADLVDRNGEVLATTLETYSLYAEPRKVWDVTETTQGILSVLPELEYAEVHERLSRDRAFVWIERGLTPKERQAVFAQGLQSGFPS